MRYVLQLVVEWSIDPNILGVNKKSSFRRDLWFKKTSLHFRGVDVVLDVTDKIFASDTERACSQKLLPRSCETTRKLVIFSIWLMEQKSSFLTVYSVSMTLFDLQHNLEMSFHIVVSNFELSLHSFRSYSVSHRAQFFTFFSCTFSYNSRATWYFLNLIASHE